jgi:hypothetical protein
MSFHRLIGPQDGYVALISVLVVGAVASAIATSLLLLGLASSRNSFAILQSSQAQALTDACIEMGIRRTVDLSTFTGSGSVTIVSSTCTYAVANGGGKLRIISASSTIGTVLRKASTTISLATTTGSTGLSVTSWQEIP